jgi:tetratricopeptide (TPR) repeat protein
MKYLRGLILATGLSLLACPRNFAATEETQGRSPAGSEPVRHLPVCGSDSGGNNVLIAPFLSSLGRSPRGTQIGKKIAYAIALALDDRKGVTAFVWDPDYREEREQGKVTSLLENAFIRGTASSPDDKQDQRLAGELARFLAEHNCHFLIGGQIVEEDKVLAISPFLFVRSSRNVTQPLDSFVDTYSNLSLTRLAHQYASQLSNFLHGLFPLLSDNIEIGCLTVDSDLREQQNPFALHIRAELLKEVASDPRFASAVELKDPPICAADSVSAQGGARVAIGAHVAPVGKEFTVAPTVTLRRDPVHLKFKLRAAGPYPDLSSVRGEYVSEVSTFLKAASSAEGSFPAFPELGLPPESELVGRVGELVQAGNREQAAILAYHSASRAPQDPRAQLALGHVLLAKELVNEAGEYLERAREHELALPAAARELLWESLSSFWQQVGATAEAREHLRKAQREYAGQSTNRSRRLTQNLALILVKAGELDEAATLLQMQPRFDQSVENLKVLAQIAAIKNSGEDLRWLQAAFDLAKDDQSIRKALFQAHVKRGNADLDRAEHPAEAASAQQHYARAQAQFEKALEIEPEAAETQYLAALSAYHRGDYENAKRWYERVISGREFRWVEASWVTLIESLLLLGRYEEVEARAQDAVKAVLDKARDTHLAALYMRYAARLLRNPDRSREELEGDEVYAQLQQLRKDASIKKLDWDFRPVVNYLRRQLIAGAAHEVIWALSRDLLGPEAVP